MQALAGVSAAIGYIASIGERYGGAAGGSRRSQIAAGWAAVEAHEHALKVRFLEGAGRVPGLHVYGISDPLMSEGRTPTFAVGKRDADGVLRSPELLTESLTAMDVYCTHGNHYCTFWEEALGLCNEQGAARLGFLHYNTEAEVDRVLDVLERAE